MSIWTALLESFHSALIDELNSSKPSSKPELGLPIRHSQLQSPSQQALIAIWVQVFAEPSGAVFLACDEKLKVVLKLQSVEALWKTVVERAHREFEHRKIKPRFGAVQGLSPDFSMPKGLSPLKRVIWIPIGLDGGKCFLGVGV